MCELSSIVLFKFIHEQRKSVGQRLSLCPMNINKSALVNNNEFALELKILLNLRKGHLF